jgi:hypothetical protein
MKQSYNFINKTTLFLVIGIVAVGNALVYHQNNVNSPENNTEFLQSKGFTSIQVGQFNFFCGKGTKLSRHFKAISPQGEEIEGTLCAGRKFFDDKIETKVISKFKPKM